MVIKLTCVKKNFAKLRDGSTIKKVNKIWMGKKSTQSLNPDDRFTLMEAVTSFDQVVICSSGVCKDNIGRACTETEKMNDFHILDYEPDMVTFVDVSVAFHAAAAIDEDGEIWILAG